MHAFLSFADIFFNFPEIPSECQTVWIVGPDLSQVISRIY